MKISDDVLNHIIIDYQDEVDNYIETFLYYFKYRHFYAQS